MNALVPALIALLLLPAAACLLADEADPCLENEPGVVCSVAGTGALGFNSDGLAPEESDLYLVSQARRGPDGLLYFMDFNNHRLRVTDDDGLLQTIAGTGFHGPGFPEVLATESPLENPIDFDFLPDGRVAFLSYHDPRILTITPEGTLRSIAGIGDIGELGNEGDGGFALFAKFIQLDGIAIEPDGTIYVSDSLANRVRVIRGNMVTTLAGTGAAEYSGDGGPATEAALHWPTALSLGPDGSLYVADSGNNVIRRISPAGAIETIAGTGEAGYSGDDGPATEARLNQPYGVDIAPDGTVYIGDRNNFRVRSVDPSGVIHTVAGNGTQGEANDPEDADSATFDFISRVTLDGNSLLISDQGNSRVRRLTLSTENNLETTKDN